MSKYQPKKKKYNYIFINKNLKDSIVQRKKYIFKRCHVFIYIYIYIYEQIRIKEAIKRKKKIQETLLIVNT